MKLARVVAVHPETHKVDLVLLDDGRRLAGVKVMSGEASSSSGRAALPVPDSQSAPDPFTAPPGKREIIACVAFYGYLPVVQGFLFPEVSEMLFPDLDRYMNRTPSDVYWTVDGKGNSELFHPSGAFIRVAETPAHEDLTGKDFHKKFKVQRNAGRQVHIHIEQAGGVASIDIAPGGAIVAKTVSTALIDAGGGATVKAPTILADSQETTCTGNLTVMGKITGQGGMAISGGAGATVAGSMTITGGDVKADDISLKGHGHIEQGDGARVSDAVT